MPLISVIMSVYNEREEWLRAAIESILNQTYSHLEFIILLDAPDNTALERVIREYAAADRRIVFLKNDVNHGLVWSLNRGLEAASGEYIARMDADDISLADRLETQLRALREGIADFAGSRLAYMDEDGLRCETAPHPSLSPAQIRSALRHLNVVPHPSWFTRAEVFRQVGAYHEIPAAEDYEWLCRAASMGIRLHTVDGVLLHYRTRAQGISRANEYRQPLSSYAIQREYRRALRTGRPMRPDAILRRIRRIDERCGEEGLPSVQRLWREGWSRLHRLRLLSGLWMLCRAAFTYPPILSSVFSQRYFRRLCAGNGTAE